MNKNFLIFILVVVFLVSGIAAYYLRPHKAVEIALIPLDSRPCNTQYPQLLGKMGNLEVKIPDLELDDYLEKANKEELWQWLTYKAENMDNIIINTTELFNGGLIESRNPASYSNLSNDLKRLEEFCRDNPDHKITVITILPRLLPSQFTDLWDYQKELSEYAINLDRALLENTDLPTAKHIPEKIVNTYLSIYDNAHILTTSLIELTREGLIDNYIIGQDDAAEFGVTNALVRDLRENYQEDLKQNVHFVYGADELTVLALAKFYLKDERNLGILGDLNILANSGNKAGPADFKLTYANDDLKKEYLPYEAITTEEILENKLGFLKVTSRSEAKNIEIVYNDVGKRDFILEAAKKTSMYRTKNSGDARQTTDNLTENSKQKNTKGVKHNPAYLGIMDVTYTNKGDVKLYQALKKDKLLKHVDGYAGWNTASNTIGTELAHFYFYHYLGSNYTRFTKEAQTEALESYLAFKYVRYAEDFIYQGILQAELEEILKSRNIDPADLAGHKEEAELILQELFKPYEKELNQHLLGEYQIGEINFTAQNIKAEISLPWERTFETQVKVDVTLEVL